MKKVLAGLLVSVAWVLAGITATGYAQTLISPNYQFEEASLGASNLMGAQSANFQSSGSSGILGIDLSASPGYQIYAGSNTTGDPSLSFAVNTSNVNFQPFSPAATSVATSTFEVVNYTSYGYVVQILGTAPTNGSHTIAPMSSTGPSQAGIDQFGINLVANTSPVSVGANPDQGQFGFGVASASYGTADNYRFVSGETIATAPKSSGKTVFTISYIINVNSLTPGGQYVGSQTIVCTGTY